MDWIFYEPDLKPILAKDPSRPGYWKGLIWKNNDKYQSLNFDVLGRKMFFMLTATDFRLQDKRIKHRLFQLNDIEEKHIVIIELFTFKIRSI